MIELKRDYGEHKAGETVILDAVDEQRLLDAGDAVTSTVDKAVDRVVGAAGTRVPHIEVVDAPVYPDNIRGFGEFARDIIMAGKGVRAPRLDKMRAQARAAYGGTYMSDTADYGDDLIPDEFVKMLFRIIHDYGDIYQRTTRLPVKGNTLLVPFLVEADRDTGAGKRHGGITASFITAGYEKSESRAKVDKLSLILKDITCLVPVTDALLSDNAVALGTVLLKLMSEAIAYTVENEIIRATTGANFDEGLINSTSTIGVGRTTAGAITWADICNLYMRIHAPLRKNMIWLVSPRAEAKLLGLQSTSGFPVYLGGGGFPTGAAAPPNTLLGKPVFVSEHASDLGSTGDLIACNLSEYLIAEKGNGLEMAQSIHLHFDYNITTFRAVMRINGQPWWASTLTMEQGNVQVSWASYLAAGLTDITTY